MLEKHPASDRAVVTRIMTLAHKHVVHEGMLEGWVPGDTRAQKCGEHADAEVDPAIDDVGALHAAMALAAKANCNHSPWCDNTGVISVLRQVRDHQITRSPARHISARRKGASR